MKRHTPLVLFMLLTAALFAHSYDINTMVTALGNNPTQSQIDNAEKVMLEIYKDDYTSLMDARKLGDAILKTDHENRLTWYRTTNAYLNSTISDELRTQSNTEAAIHTRQVRKAIRTKDAAALLAAIDEMTIRSTGRANLIKWAIKNNTFTPEESEAIEAKLIATVPYNPSVYNYQKQKTQKNSLKEDIKSYFQSGQKELIAPLVFEAIRNKQAIPTETAFLETVRRQMPRLYPILKKTRDFRPSPANGEILFAGDMTVTSGSETLSYATGAFAKNYRNRYGTIKNWQYQSWLTKADAAVESNAQSSGTNWVMAELTAPADIKEIEIINYTLRPAYGVKDIRIGYKQDGQWKLLDNYTLPLGHYSQSDGTIIAFDKDRVEAVMIDVLSSYSDKYLGIGHVFVRRATQ